MTNDLAASLGQCGKWFMDYYEGHLKKGNMDKAYRNLERAAFCLNAVLDARRKEIKNDKKT